MTNGEWRMPEELGDLASAFGICHSAFYARAPALASKALRGLATTSDLYLLIKIISAVIACPRGGFRRCGLSSGCSHIDSIHHQ